MQQGLFVSPVSSSRKTIKEQLDENCNILEIDRELREEVMELLDKVGYNEFRLMPNLDNVRREINKKYRSKA